MNYSPQKLPDAVVAGPAIECTFDTAINYAFQQNAIPVIKELCFRNDDVARRDLVIRVSSEPAFAEPAEIRIQAVEPSGEFRVSPVDLKLGHDFLANLHEKVAGWLKMEVAAGGTVLCSRTERIALLARNEWCGLASLPEILAAFVLPNDPALLPILRRASEILQETTDRGGLNGYQDRSRKRAWEQAAAIYRAVGELGIQYISPPASFENSGQKVFFPAQIVTERFGTCLDLTLLFAACLERAGLHPLVLIHEGHAYAGCWLEERSFPDPAADGPDVLQQIRKHEADSLITVFETTLIASGSPGVLTDAERLAKPHLETDQPFRLALDVRRSRISRIVPLPIPGQHIADASAGSVAPTPAEGIGERKFTDPLVPEPSAVAKPVSRVDQWRSRLLDLSLRNRLLNFRETRSSIRILSAAPEHVEDELAAENELALHPRPKLLSADDPRHAETVTLQQRTDALNEYLAGELKNRRLHTHLEASDHARRLTEIYRAARNAIDENGTNTLFAAVGILEWRETEHSDRVHRAPLLLVPVELKRKSVLEGFALRRLDEETRLNVTLMEMLRQDFQKEIPGLDPLPEDDSGVNVARVFQIFRDAVRELRGWEVKTEIWLGLFSFTKFLLWKDLSDRLGELTRNRVVNHLINGAGTPYLNPPDDIRPSELDDRFHPRDVFCPRSADSSQLAAIMAAAAGHDFVLEGPPGTGKSQTITNIIANCLAHGKRVLFVAEKRAALDVVHRRLREEGLEPFCLELHSNKIGKADVLAQFDRTLKFVAGDGAIDWEHRTAELERLRASLNAYTRVLHRPAPCGLSAYDCFDYLLPRRSEATVQFDTWANILGTTKEKLAELRDLAGQLQERARAVLPLQDHPLTLVECDEWSPAWAEKTHALLDELAAHTTAALEAAGRLRTWLRCPDQPASASSLLQLRDLAESLLAPQPVGPAFATTPWNQLLSDLDTWIALTEERTRRRSVLDRILVRSQSNGPSVVCESWPAADAEANLARSRELIALARKASETARDLQEWLQSPRRTATRTELARLLSFTESIAGAPPVAGAFALTPWPDWAGHFHRWLERLLERIQLRSTLTGYDEAGLLALDLDTLKQKWESGRNAWFLPKWLRVGFVRRQLRSVRPDRTPPEMGTLDAVISAALRLRAVNDELAAVQADAETMLGERIWAGGEPDPDYLASVRAWGATLHERLTALAGDDPDWLAAVRQLLGGLLAGGVSGFSTETPTGQRIAKFQDATRQFDAAFEPLAASAALRRNDLDNAPDFPAAVASALESFVENVPRLRAINDRLTAAAPVARECLGVIWADGEPAADALAEAREWGKSLHARIVACAGDDLVWLGQLRQLLASLFAEGPDSYAAGTGIGSLFTRFRETFSTFEDSLGKVASQLNLRREPIDSASDHFQAVLELTGRLSGGWQQIRLWCAWQKTRRLARNRGLELLIAALESPDGAALDVRALFERSFRKALLFALIDREGVLREFFGGEHNERIERFRQLDDKVTSLSRELIRVRLAAQIPGDQNVSEVPRTEIGLLQREIRKKTRHIPVRRLLAGIPNLLPRLKPCVLMSPLSVAQYLEPSHEAFDVVIFDEASQIPVWDAIGAIARGRQLIVVGDPKQLPPTSFFNSAGSTEDDDLTAETPQDLESILDELMSHQVLHKRLQWHYRSRHEGLITFSNRQYYQNDLLTFPSPESGFCGVRFRYLPKARYDKGQSRTNPVEAKTLVKELVKRLREHNGPCRSYGVVTFSQAQQQLIENLLDEERRKHPEIEVHFGDEPPIEGEPVFVKNLENVQGDERDVIFFSVCYGPDEAGKVSMNFGPLNREGGERRLNVAITRAKHEVTVFSCLRADQIDLTRTRARGVGDLKQFLDYAERGPRVLSGSAPAQDTGAAESEFETMVADLIRKAGYEVHHQVGCSDYRIDLAVVNPASPGRYLLGIECDGSTYHRAATARDRDKLRQAVLEGLGWRLHRIWSTDWWHDPENEAQRLLNVIHSLDSQRQSQAAAAVSQSDSEAQNASQV